MVLPSRASTIASQNIGINKGLDINEVTRVTRDTEDTEVPDEI